jgi:catechol 2,3-dioxygenase-like lactoylglutathione lyase family enzyme
MHVHHLAFRTPKLLRLVRFYRDVVGLRVVRTNKLQRGRIRSVWLKAGTTLLMLEAADAGEAPYPKGSYELVCFGARTKKEVEAARARMGRRVRVEGETDYTFYFRDPDGRRVGISCYRWKP